MECYPPLGRNTQLLDITSLPPSSCPRDLPDIIFFIGYPLPQLGITHTKPLAKTAKTAATMQRINMPPKATFRKGGDNDTSSPDPRKS